ncbi:MAG: His-Xaa-Ser system protein HxsD [Elusimicrobia bacterium]|nr:His-Xaa-Ser system protein HxsD [Elusimicrobiota bacterium]
MADSATKGLSLDIDTGVYSMDAVQAAAYTFTDRAYVRITRRGAKGVSVSLQPKAKDADAQALAGEFHNELLHETLRRKVSDSNKKIREFIVTKALVSAQVPSAPPPAAAPAEECPECAAEARAAQEKKGAAPQAQPAAVDPDLEKEIEKLLTEIEKSGPGGSDPLGVAVPWEKKFGAKGAAKGKTKDASQKKGKKA